MSDCFADVTAVVPCYNAGERLAPVIARLREVVARVIVVDDGSSDGAAQQAGEQGAQVITFPQNRGKGFALLEGFQAAMEYPETQCVCVVDADGQHDPSEIPGLYEAMQREGADLVIGSRSFDQAHVPLRSRFGNKLTVAITRVLLGRRIPDTQSGFRLHSRRFIEHVLPHVQGGRYETEMEILVRAVRGGFVVLPVPIKTIYEEGNPSSHFNKLRDSFRIYRRLFAVSMKVRRR